MKQGSSDVLNVASEIPKAKSPKTAIALNTGNLRDLPDGSTDTKMCLHVTDGST